jgi:hypothetical protein
MTNMSQFYLIMANNLNLIQELIIIIKHFHGTNPAQIAL